MSPALTAENICKSFAQQPVLHGVTLRANQGEVISIIGSSGSGKSTFLRCINFLEVPDSGRIALGDEEIIVTELNRDRIAHTQRRTIERFRVQLGMVFQSFNLWSHLSVLQNVTEGPVSVLKQSRTDADAYAMELLDKVGIAEKHASYPAQLSGGQQQRVAIARALAMRPRILLFDEPTSALDPELVGEVLRVIRQLADEGRTMIVVTHEMGFARELSHRTLFLHQGQVEEEGSPEQLFGNPQSLRCRQFLQSVL